MYTHPQCTTVPGNILTDKYPLQHGLLFSNNYLVSSTKYAHMCAYELQRPGRKGAAITDDSRARITRSSNMGSVTTIKFNQKQN